MNPSADWLTELDSELTASARGKTIMEAFYEERQTWLNTEDQVDKLRLLFPGLKLVLEEIQQEAFASANWSIWHLASDTLAITWGEPK